MRNLLLFLLILVGIYYVRRLLAGEKPKEGAPQPGPSEPAREIEQVVPCAHCGVLVPPSEGIEAEGRFYCSSEHLRLGPGAS